MKEVHPVFDKILKEFLASDIKLDKITQKYIHALEDRLMAVYIDLEVEKKKGETENETY